MESAATRQWRPKAKREDLMVEEAGGELIVYDLKRHRVHCLNAAAVRVWRLCTGRRTVAELAAKLESALEPAARETVVGDAIAQFERLGLVEPSDSVAPRRMSRRELVRKIGIGALAAGVVLPLVTSIVAPTPAYAQSCRANGTPCATSAQCCSRCCNMQAAGLHCADGPC